MEKHCKRCDTTKSVDQFPKRSDTGKPAAYCFECERVRKKMDARRYHSDPEVRRAVTLRQKLWTYGLTEEQYTKMQEAAAGACEICRDPFVKSPRIDHCHSSGVVRGLLCHNCNVALGHFRDSPALLAKAMEYLHARANGV